MKAEASVLLAKMEYLYENIYNLLSAFQEATTTQNSSVTVTLKDDEGNISTKTVNSFQKILSELTRIDNNYKSLISDANLSYTLNADGSISQQTKTSFINAEYLENFDFNGYDCYVDKKSLINDLVYPQVKIPITIDSKLKSNINCKIFEVSSGWEKIPDNPSILNMTYLKSQGLIEYKEIIRTLELSKNQIKYFGKFTIETLSLVSTNNYKIVLDTVKYNNLVSTSNTINLKIDDILVSKSGSSKYIITDIDVFTKTIYLTCIAGSEVLSVGTNKLYFNEIVDSEENIVGIPIKASQTIVVFLSTENIANISYPSIGIKLDTSTYKVTYEDETYTIDEFFSNYVINYSEYLSSLINETTIPYTLGVIPDKPNLLTSNFKVIQINKHLTDSKTTTEIEVLNKQKQKIQNDIDFKQTQIDQIQTELDTQSFNSAEEKETRLTKIKTYRTEINTLKTNLLNVAQNIDSKAINSGLKTLDPKYRVIGFWPIQTPIYSTLTKKQHIIKYDVQYRYLSKNIDIVNTTSYTMYDEDGNPVTVSFSPWVDLNTRTLLKVINDNGDLEWESLSMDSVDDININQLSISIKESESIEIRVKAVSEAGYPLSPLKSDWSEILRVDFPSELSDNNNSSTITKNNTDLKNAEFNQILTNLGLIAHIAGTIKESEKTFLHDAGDITSGQYTSEQKNIALNTCISNIISRISALESNSTSKNITISLIDFNSETYSITNNTTLEINAGNYADLAPILNKDTWGSIIRKKAYIKIKNTNSVPIEIKTLIPGSVFNQLLAPTYYNVGVQNSDGLLIQSAKQIIYFRNVDLTGQSGDAFKLVSSKLTNTKTYPNPIDINSAAADSNKNIVYRNSINNISICALNESYLTNFVAFTTEHPLFSVDNLNSSELLTEFNRIQLYTNNIKVQQYQNEYYNDDEVGLGFNDYDFYSIGENSCGSFLYPVFSNISNIQVVGNTTTATLIIPKESEILIPIIFEYRMIDRLGNINGELNYDVSSGLTYIKKLGIDLYINNEIFKFDINVTAKLKSKVTTIDTTNVNSVIAKFNNESSAGIN
jgi:hypothetical protein